MDVLQMDGMYNISLMGGQARAILIEGTQMVERARQIHGLSRTATAALGRTLMAASMMGAMLKGERESLTVTLKGSGPIGTVLAVGKSDATVKGYVDNPEETAMTLREHADGRIWLHTGDLGTMDADGFVYFRQRIKRMIVTSGYNVYPSQLENIIDGHEKVLYSCVIGVKDPYKMQKVKAYVVLRPGVQPSDEVKREILKYCEKHIAKYAMPYDIEFREELPKTLVGKVAYRKLEEEANAQHVA